MFHDRYSKGLRSKLLFIHISEEVALKERRITGRATPLYSAAQQQAPKERQNIPICAVEKNPNASDTPSEGLGLVVRRLRTFRPKASDEKSENEK
jgi:hypothetical protein